MSRDNRSRDKKSRRNLEQIRVHAVRRVLGGEKPAEVMRELGLNRSSIYGWIKRFQEGGEAALQSGVISGRAPLLDNDSIEATQQLIFDKYPDQLGFEEQLWTPQNLLSLMEREQGLRPGKTAYRHMMGRVGLRHQRLKTLLAESEDTRVKQWLNADYERLQRQAVREGAKTLGITFTPVFSAHKKISGGYLQAVSSRGELQFMLYSSAGDAVTLTQEKLEEFLRRLFASALASEKGKLYFVTGQNDLLPDLFRRSKIKGLLDKANGFFIDLFADTVIPESATKAAKRINHQAEAIDIEKWTLLLEKSLLDTEQPLGSFLTELDSYIDGQVIILPDLKIPSTPVRHYLPKETDLEFTIRRNQGMIDLWHHNPLLKVLKKPGDMYDFNDVISEEDWEQNAFCRMIRSTGNPHTLGFAIAGPNDTICGLIAYRWYRKKPFGQREHNLLHRLRPHLENALAIAINNWRNMYTIEALEEATDHLEIASFVLDGGGNVIKYNGTGRDMLEQGQITLDGHRLRFGAKRDQSDFEQAVQQSITWRRAPIGNKPVEALRFSSLSGSTVSRSDLGILVQPIMPPSLGIPHSVAVSPHVIVYISMPEKPRQSPQQQLIQRLFNLTSREAHLTSLLSSGLDIGEAAKSMQVTQATARTYLQHIYEKIGVKRRQDLVQRVMKSVALLA